MFFIANTALHMTPKIGKGSAGRQAAEFASPQHANPQPLCVLASRYPRLALELSPTFRATLVPVGTWKMSAPDPNTQAQAPNLAVAAVLLQPTGNQSLISANRAFAPIADT